ncbi:MAG: phosphoesterase PA-phosphatase-like protein [Candidatus Jorgensenbacteria bacterium GW2011_GWA2_45_13]|uniref:Phosphoesterase PA-phosphatase-like protein n=1 Tax=Candidatus Jorgensenbacteria bacterium GW2011_GWA2_45_13 TaxID=1618662 RepID=A0A0G1L9E8_9BACT|nr:MAG: phosphoesterase PA-phosphatase-like protein [Candidatus Jorgensenbacteria bacterium GW2011_GWA2_45_13]
MPFDLSLFNLTHGAAGKSGLLDFFGVFFANNLPYILIIAVIVFLFKKRSMKERTSLFVFFSLTVLLSRGFFTEVIRFFYTHPRPFDALGFTPLIPESGNSFPSGHAAFFFALAAAIWYCNRKWGWWFLGLALLNGVARIFVGVHWPSDILGGIVVGFVSLWIVLKLIKEYLPSGIFDRVENEATEDTIGE